MVGHTGVWDAVIKAVETVDSCVGQVVTQALESGYRVFLTAEGVVDDAVFRLALAVIDEMQIGKAGMPVTYFALWMNRLMGWMPELGHCVVCGLDLRGGTVWYSDTSDGMTCSDDRRSGSVGLSAASVALAERMFRGNVKGLAEEAWPRERGADLRRFAVETLERHLERRLQAGAALAKLGG